MVFKVFKSMQTVVNSHVLQATRNKRINLKYDVVKTFINVIFVSKAHPCINNRRCVSFRSLLYRESVHHSSARKKRESESSEPSHS